MRNIIAVISCFLLMGCSVSNPPDQKIVASLSSTSTTTTADVHILPVPYPSVPKSEPKALYTAPIKNIDMSENVIFLMGEINEDTVNETIRQLSEIKNSQPVYLLLDSPGGSVYDGARLITQMEGNKAPVNTVCVGMCASMAAMIHSYGVNRYMTNRSTLMFHPASGAIRGQIQNIESRVKSISSYVGKLEANIQKRSGMKKKDYDARIVYEFWVDSDEAKELKLVDEVVALSRVVPPQNSALIPFDQKKVTTIRELDLYWIFPGKEYK